MGMVQSPSVVVHVINIQHVALCEAENDSPICANPYRPEASEVALERMQPETGQVHIRNRSGGVEPDENVPKLDCVFRYHAARVVVLIKAFQTLLADRTDHISYRNALRNARQLKAGTRPGSGRQGELLSVFVEVPAVVGSFDSARTALRALPAPLRMTDFGGRRTSPMFSRSAID
jgi:hypothetical protein